MWIWFAIPVGVGIIAAFIAVARRGSTEGIYVGIVESGLAIGTDDDSLQIRAYVEETLVDELPAPSRLIGRMFIRETNRSVPLMFVRVPPYVSPKIERSGEWRERFDVPVLPVIFRFDPAPDLAVHLGQLVDVYIGERSRAHRSLISQSFRRVTHEPVDESSRR
jgi:HlyD family secretion protein